MGDNVYFIWLIGWFKKALFELRVNPFDVWFLNYPEGWNIASTEIAPAQLLIALPFALSGGETFGYNMTMLISFVLAGMIMFAWVRDLSGSFSAGFVSGTIYACLPYWQMHFLAGHLNLCGTQWIPLFFWGWFNLLQPDRDSKPFRSAAMAAFGLGLSALSSQYYVYMMAFVAALQGLIYALIKRKALLADRLFWLGMFRFLLMSLPLMLLAELPFLTLAGSGGMPDRNWLYASKYSAGISDFLLPATNHFLWKGWINAHFNRELWIEATLYVGAFTLALALLEIFRRKTATKAVRTLLIIGALCALILAMGTDLHWNGEQVKIQLPQFLQPWLGAEITRIRLPALVLFKYFPFFAKQRALMRFGLFTLLFAACLAGLGFAGIIQGSSPRRRRLFTAAALLLVLLDFLPTPHKPMTLIQPRAVDNWLAEQTAEGSLMRVPFTLNDDQYGTYLSLYNGKRFIGGFFNAFPPPQYQKILPVMSEFPSDESLALARELNVSYVELEIGEITQDESAARAERMARAIEFFGLKPLYRDQEVIVYEIP